MGRGAGRQRARRETGFEQHRGERWLRDRTTGARGRSAAGPRCRVAPEERSQAAARWLEIANQPPEGQRCHPPGPWRETDRVGRTRCSNPPRRAGSLPSAGRAAPRFGLPPGTGALPGTRRHSSAGFRALCPRRLPQPRAETSETSLGLSTERLAPGLRRRKHAYDRT